MEAWLEAAAPARERMNTSEAGPSDSGGGSHSHFLEDTLTLFESGGRRLCPLVFLLHPPAQFYDIPTALRGCCYAKDEQKMASSFTFKTLPH